MEAVPPLTKVDAQSINVLLTRFRDRSEDTGAVMRHLGFRLTLTDGGEPTELTEVSIRCGSTSQKNASIPNNLITHLPSDSTEAVSVGRASAILRAGIATMDARWGVVAHPKQLSSDHPYVGWITFLPVDPRRVPTLPKPCRVESVPGQGVLVVAGEEPLDPTDAKERKHYYEIERILREDGLMEPIDYWS